VLDELGLGDVVRILVNDELLRQRDNAMRFHDVGEMFAWGHGRLLCWLSLAHAMGQVASVYGP
jgi:hypothetical protein